MSSLPPPVVREHQGVSVVRDDLLDGGTKLRYFADLFDGGVREVVYASPCEGGAQISLAWAARLAGGRATIFCAARKDEHPRTREARRLGARVEVVRPGYLTVVQARARRYAKASGALLLPCGGDIDGATEAIRTAALATGIQPRSVWCAAGSGTLARGLAAAWPHAAHHVVEVGRTLTPLEVGGATIHRTRYRFGQPCKAQPPFPSDRHYDAKAWEVLTSQQPFRGRLFWNVMGPPTEQA